MASSAGRSGSGSRPWHRPWSTQLPGGAGACSWLAPRALQKRAGRRTSSVHLCFICALHLANEHGLRITGVPTLDRLEISGVPAAQ